MINKLPLSTEANVGYSAVQLLLERFEDLPKDVMFDISTNFFYPNAAPIFRNHALTQALNKESDLKSAFTNMSNVDDFHKGLILGLYGKEGLIDLFKIKALIDITNFIEYEGKRGIMTLRANDIIQNYFIRTGINNSRLYTPSPIEPLENIDTEFGIYILKEILEAIDTDMNSKDIENAKVARLMIDSLIGIVPNTRDVYMNIDENRVLGQYVLYKGSSINVFRFIPHESIYIVMKSKWILGKTNLIKSLNNAIWKILTSGISRLREYKPVKEEIDSLINDTSLTYAERYLKFMDYLDEDMKGTLVEEPDKLSQLTELLVDNSSVDLQNMLNNIDPKVVNVGKGIPFSFRAHLGYMGDVAEGLNTLKTTLAFNNFKLCTGIEHDEEADLLFLHIMYLFSGGLTYIPNGGLLDLDEIGYLGLKANTMVNFGWIDNLMRVNPSYNFINEKGLLDLIESINNRRFSKDGVKLRNLTYQDLKGMKLISTRPNSFRENEESLELDDDIVVSMFRAIFDNSEHPGNKTPLPILRKILEPILALHEDNIGNNFRVKEVYTFVSRRQVNEFIIPMIDEYPRIRKEFRKLYVKLSL